MKNIFENEVDDTEPSLAGGVLFVVVGLLIGLGALVGAWYGAGCP